MFTLIILVRHGQTEWNRIERFRGRYDLSLNDTGIEQAEKTAAYIQKMWKPVALYSSPLKRAVQTAEKITETCGIPIQTSHGLMDIDYGQWQGLTPEEVQQQWPELLTHWYEHPETVQIPGGESLKQVRERSMSALSGFCRMHMNDEIVLVSHTVVNRLLILGILDLGNDHFWNLSQEPCAINLIEKSERGFKLACMNDTCHLK